MLLKSQTLHNNDCAFQLTQYTFFSINLFLSQDEGTGIPVCEWGTMFSLLPGIGWSNVNS